MKKIALLLSSCALVIFLTLKAGLFSAGTITVGVIENNTDLVYTTSPEPMGPINFEVFINIPAHETVKTLVDDQPLPLPLNIVDMQHTRWQTGIIKYKIEEVAAEKGEVSCPWMHTHKTFQITTNQGDVTKQTLCKYVFSKESLKIIINADDSLTLQFIKTPLQTGD